MSIGDRAPSYSRPQQPSSTPCPVLFTMCKDMVVRPDKYLIWMSFLPAVEQYEAETFLHPIVVKILEWDRCYVFAKSNAKKANRKA